MQKRSQRNATSDAAGAPLKGIQELKEQWLWWPSFRSRYLANRFQQIDIVNMQFRDCFLRSQVTLAKLSHLYTSFC